MKAFLITICPILFITLLLGCSTTKLGLNSSPKLANIYLTHWKITIPSPRVDSKLINVGPIEIFDYARDKGAYAKVKIYDIEVSH